jgi:hypothetical protein
MRRRERSGCDVGGCCCAASRTGGHEGESASSITHTHTHTRTLDSYSALATALCLPSLRERRDRSDEGCWMTSQEDAENERSTRCGEQLYFSTVSPLALRAAQEATQAQKPQQPQAHSSISRKSSSSPPPLQDVIICGPLTSLSCVHPLSATAWMRSRSRCSASAGSGTKETPRTICTLATAATTAFNSPARRRCSSTHPLFFFSFFLSFHGEGEYTFSNGIVYTGGFFEGMSGRLLTLSVRCQAVA